MKKILTILCLSFLFFGCKKNENPVENIPNLKINLNTYPVINCPNQISLGMDESVTLRIDCEMNGSELDRFTITKVDNRGEIDFIMDSILTMSNTISFYSFFHINDSELDKHFSPYIYNFKIKDAVGNYNSFTLTINTLPPPPPPSPGNHRLSGVWSVTETESKLIYEVMIEHDSATNRVKIFGFANSGSMSNPATGVVIDNSLVLDVNQTIGDGWVINGAGTISETSTSINFPYTLNDGANLHMISAVYTKITN